jgi:aerobic carbon-monoxide dehydrogenase medium subunit
MAPTAVLAGGTDVMRQIARGSRAPASVLYIGRVQELAILRVANGRGAHIGALVTQADLVQTQLSDGAYRALREAAATCGSGQTRNVATVGGNLCNGAPQADLVPALLVHNAVVTLESRDRGTRKTSAAEFLLGAGATGRLPDELLTGIELEPVPARTAEAYVKVGRRSAMEIAIVGLAVRVTLSSSGAIMDDVRVAIGAVAPKAFRAAQCEAILIGKAPTDELIGAAAQALLQEASPQDDFLATAAYRSGVLPGILARAVYGCTVRDELAERLKEALVNFGAIQCGYCTPGVVVTLVSLLRTHRSPSEEQIRRALAGHLCRCTGYVHMIDATLAVAAGPSGAVA